MQCRTPQAESYKTVLLRVADEASFDRTLSAAVALGRAFGAHVIAFAALPRTILIPAGMPGLPDVVPLDGHRRATQALHARLAPIFRHRCETEGLTAEWRVADPDDMTRWAAAAGVTRSVDLIVAPTPTVKHHPLVTEHDTEDLLLASGRPVLLLPRGGDLRGRPERILVAWNAGREAARAVFDALPLLRSARVVTIASVSGRRARSTNDLACALQRHGVSVLINEIDVAVPEAGTALLSTAKAEGSELLVIGGYGRSRFAELALGGTTRHVLRHTHVPVLVSH